VSGRTQASDRSPIADPVLDRLLVGLPDDDAAEFRRMRAAQRPWGFGERPAIVVVDMTRGFTEEQYQLGNSRTGMPVARKIRNLLDTARPLGVPVVFTVPGVYDSEVATGGWLRGLPITEYSIGSAPGECDIVPILEPGDDEPVIVKPKPSAFYGTQLQSILTHWRIDTLVITGVGTGRCIRATVDDAFARNYRVIVPIECVGGGIGISHRVELLDIGVHVEVVADLVTLEELLVHLRDRQAVT
jgi:nicotinamidase-related amidase